MNIMQTITQVDDLLQSGIKRDYEYSTAYSVLLGDTYRIAKSNPEALEELRNKYLGKYLAMTVSRGNKYAP